MNLFKYLTESFEWLRKRKEGTSSEQTPEPVHNPSESPWLDEIISIEKIIHKAASQGLTMMQYRDFVISSLDSLLLNNGAQEINEVGVAYDSTKHRPNVAVEVPSGMIVSSVLKPGIIFNGRVLKRATVEFSKEN